jgi:glutaredoxin
MKDNLMEQKTQKTAVAAPKDIAKTIEKEKPVTKQHWLKDSVRNNNWVIYCVPECTYTPEVARLLKEHGENNVQFITYSELTAQDAINKGRNYSPCIFLNSKLLGSLGDLEHYYKRNFFSNMQQATT